MSFLGMASYYRKFCPNFSAVVEPLTQLLRKNTQFIWMEPCQLAFEKLKAMLQSAPVLSVPDFNRPFKIAVDASDVAAGAILLQEDHNESIILFVISPVSSIKVSETTLPLKKNVWPSSWHFNILKSTYRLLWNQL